MATGTKNPNPKIQYKTEIFTFPVAMANIIITIDRMSNAELFYFASLWNEPIEKWKRFHHEAASSGRLHVSQTMGLLHAIRRASNAMWVQALTNARTHTFHLVALYMKNHSHQHSHQLDKQAE